MLRFNTLLREAGVDPGCVQLVRHKDTRIDRTTTPYSLWLHDRPAFEGYQRLQSRDVFQTGATLASFVVPPNNETLFAGLFEVKALARNATPVTCPVWQKEYPPGTMNLYDIYPREELAVFEGLLTIDWGDGLRSWVQRAWKHDKPVLELRRRREEPQFPGFAAFRTSTSDLFRMPATWIEVLRATGGVYLLVSQSGEQYVGSATGQEGFWSRWRAYARDGHGGNLKLRTHGRPPYAIVVLETAGSLDTREDVLRSEQRWKERLGSRAFGLNLN